MTSVTITNLYPGLAFETTQIQASVAAHPGVALTGLVASFYANVLHRTPDGAGQAFWIDVLDRHALSVADVLIQFSESPENVAALTGVVQNGCIISSTRTSEQQCTGDNLWFFRAIFAKPAIYPSGTYTPLCFPTKIAQKNQIFGMGHEIGTTGSRRAQQPHGHEQIRAPAVPPGR
jgi:hypothetical protein